MENVDVEKPLVENTAEEENSYYKINSETTNISNSFWKEVTDWTKASDSNNEIFKKKSALFERHHIDEFWQCKKCGYKRIHKITEDKRLD